MAIGIVKFYNPEKGYGFIAPEDGAKDVFVHASALKVAGLDQLNDGQKVSYEVEAGNNGRTAAVNIQLL